MNKPSWLITHTPMKHGWTSSEWQGDTPEEAIKGFLAWCDNRGEFIEVLGIKRTNNLQEQLDAVADAGRMDTTGD